MLSLKRHLLAAGVCVLACVVSGGAFAVDVNFCKSGETCVDGLVKNKAAVIVTRTHITQEGKHGCEKIEKTVEKNLTNGGAKIDLKINKECRYKVRFTTTDGCTGDKEGQISSSEAEEGKTHAYLKGGCGSLHVNITAN